MHAHSTPTPYFPDNLEQYAPWVAQRGLTAPYGECQCGCGQRAPIAKYSDVGKKSGKGKPKIFVHGHQAKRPLVIRFWAKVDKRGPDDCWLWTASHTAEGYGHIGDRGQDKRAHRLSWEIHYGPIPVGLKVLHRCDNPPCVNPLHLFLGTDSDNSKDRNIKNRAAPKYGEHNGRHVLTESLVRIIRERIAQGEGTTSLAREFGVTKGAMHRLKVRETWRHIP